MTTHHQVAIVGTGFAGLGMAAALKRHGMTDFVLFERSNEVGGTWRDNTYPGCACDVKSDLYSFSFAPNPEWTHRYARQPEILEYLRRVATDLGLRSHVRFGHEVRRAEWDDAEALWRIHTTAGTFTARFLVSGHGPLIEARWPDIPGLEGFQGPKFHSARWDHSVDLTGKRVGVIGTGASAIQIVPEVRQLAGHLTVFQRTAPWVLPRMDHPTSDRRRELFRRYPALQRAVRQYIFGGAEIRHLFFANAKAGRHLEGLARKFIAASVKDPTLREKVTPDYRIGCKRILFSDDYYPALQQPNVDLVTDSIREVRGNTLITAGGRAHEIDVLVGATGFNVTRPRFARCIVGRGGRTLYDTWDERTGALHGTTVAGFPNLFVLVGPNTALGHNSVVYIIEAQVHYILQAMRHAQRQHLLAIEPKPEAQRVYNEQLQAKLRASVWNSGGCGSWYLDEGGFNITLWPDRAMNFRNTLRHFDPGLYQGRLSPRPVPPMFQKGG